MSASYKRALAVIPARGGSKRVPRKNLRSIGGRPLVAHAIDAARESGCFEEIVLSSDDDEILAIGADSPGVRLVKRAAEHAGDEATVFSYLLALVQESRIKDHYDAVALLLPTAPFRTAETVRRTAAALTSTCDAAFTVSPYEFPIQFALSLDEESGLATPAWNPSPLASGQTRSQNQQQFHHPNGVAFIGWIDKYIANGGFYRGRMRAVLTTRQEAFDIDTEEDFAYASYLFDRPATHGA